MNLIKNLKTPQKKQMFWTLSPLIVLLGASAALFAQEVYPDQAMNLMNRMANLEAENRELRGQLEETQHELSVLTQRIDTLNADIDYRLKNAEGGEMPLPLQPSVPLITEAEGKTSGMSSAEQEYDKARSFLEQGDYEAAERAFAAFLVSYPKDQFAGAAQYWLGVTYFVRGQHEKAVTAFAKGYKKYPKSSKAPENLLKLAKSLSALDRTADACTTLKQLSSEHPHVLVSEVTEERKRLNCK